MYAAQLLAAMEAQAFIESDLNHLLDTGLSVIPGDSTIAGIICNLRTWRAADGDWRVTRERIANQSA